MTMVGLTLHQPYATLVALGEKENETRSWKTSHRGEVLITAAAMWNNELADNVLRNAQMVETLTLTRKRFRQNLDGPPPFAPMFPGLLPLGAAVAVADLVSCYPTYLIDSVKIRSRELAFGNYGEGRWVWRFANVRMLERPVPIKGFQRLWWVEPSDEERIRATLAA